MLDIHPLKRDWLHFENSVSVVYAINKGTGTVHVQDSSRYLPFIPPLHFHSEIRAEIKKKFTHLSGIYAKISLEYLRDKTVYTLHLTLKHQLQVTCSLMEGSGRVSQKNREDPFYPYDRRR